jgi:hypothetical protein
VLLGALGSQFVGIDDDRHLMTVAGSRAGKGVSAIVPNLLTYRGSVLAIDPKGELACITAEYRAKSLRQKVYVLDPFGRLAAVEWAKGYRSAYNPMTILKAPGSKGLTKTAIENAGLIADALIVPGGGDTHWGFLAQTAENMQRILRGVEPGDLLGGEAFSKLRKVDRREIRVDLVAPVEVDVLPGHRGDALEDLGGDELAAGLQFVERLHRISAL